MQILIKKLNSTYPGEAGTKKNGELNVAMK
jgi:hypothetical protein